MEDQKLWLITDDNGIIYDLIVGDESKRELAERTKEFIAETHDNDWLKIRLTILPLEGKIHKGHINIITTIKLNNIPFRAIANNFNNVTEIVDDYLNRENEYRKYKFHTEFIKIN